MTAPVTQRVAPVKTERTAPVTPVTQAAVPGGLRVPFLRPEGVTLESAPEPLDPRQRLRLIPAATEQLPGSHRATLPCSGTGSPANCDEHRVKLQAARAVADLAMRGQSVLAHCNGPMTPGFMRRNEFRLALR